jgi:hypothetical protein
VIGRFFTNLFTGVYNKAILGAALAGGSVLYKAIDNGGGVSDTEWLEVAGAVLASFGIVWTIPNLPASTARRSVRR